MLNLAFTDSVNGGWPVGNVSTLPGKSQAGKTVLILSTFAEACLDDYFRDYRLIYDDVERRNDFDLKRLFPPLIPRLETPSGLLYKDFVKGSEDSGISNTIQDLLHRMMLLKKEGRSFVYVVDSLDSLSSEEELLKNLKKAIESEKGEAAKKLAGSYNVEKAKILGEILRQISGVIADTNSVLIITQQIRQRIGAMPGQDPYTTSGGEAPEFYSHVRPFLTKVGSIKKLKRVIGVQTLAKMKKSSITGKYRDVKFDIYYDMGIDDVGSMVQFLLDEGHWKSGSWITAEEFDIRANGKDELVKAIENGGHERRLKRIVQRKWNEIEEALKLRRKPRYV